MEAWGFEPQTPCVQGRCSPAELCPLGFSCFSIVSASILLSFNNNGRMGSSGLEPPTSRLSGARSNQLSYEPISTNAETLHSAFAERSSPLVKTSFATFLLLFRFTFQAASPPPDQISNNSPATTYSPGPSPAKYLQPLTS